MEKLAERSIAGLHTALVQEVTSLPRQTPILDLGCGTGAWLSRLRGLGFVDLTGVEIDPPAIDGAVVVGANLDKGSPPLAGRKYGVVTAIEVIEHLEHVGALLTTIKEALSADGFAIVTTPNIQSLRARVKFMLTGKLPSFDERGDPTHIAPIWVPALEKMARRHGLELSRAWTYPSKGSLIFGRPIRAISALARIAAPDQLPGDTLCVAMRHLP